MKYGPVVLTAGFTGLLSFSLLAVAVGTEYWCIIDVNKPNYTDADDLSSHSGLWRIYEGENRISVIPSFSANMSSLSVGERHILSLHRVVVIMLSLSMVLLVLGWIFGIVSSLACSPKLLAATASYFLLCSVFTLSGVSVYIKYSDKAMEEFQLTVPPEVLVFVHVSFGWSFATAWLSYTLEVATGLLLLLAARISQIKGRYDSGVAFAML